MNPSGYLRAVAGFFAAAGLAAVFAAVERAAAGLAAVVRAAVVRVAVVFAAVERVAVVFAAGFAAVVRAEVVRAAIVFAAGFAAVALAAGFAAALAAGFAATARDDTAFEATVFAAGLAAALAAVGFAAGFFAAVVLATGAAFLIVVGSSVSFLEHRGESPFLGFQRKCNAGLRHRVTNTLRVYTEMIFERAHTAPQCVAFEGTPSTRAAIVERGSITTRNPSDFKGDRGTHRVAGPGTSHCRLP